ncbi:MAG: protein kinase [Candidatus Aminicenantes bacterium]|nr:MAG: protein kinase [Candidatus Aminicenantes bacterium]
MECPKCTFKNPDNTHFCGNCASPLHHEDENISLTKTLQVSTNQLVQGSIIAGKYKILERLGIGGMGVVYKAEDTKLKRMVALKFLSPELTQNERARERFIHEAQAASALDHPNICTIHEIDETEEGQMYIAMAFYTGESMKEKIQRGPLSLKDTLDIAIQVSKGLAKAHEHDIVHRDIKPANIMMTDDGLAKIVDFGVAKLSGSTRVTRDGTAVGTAAYMSPEQAMGEEVDQRTDIWALGVLLFEIMTGEPPFKGENEQAILYSILNREPNTIKGLETAVPKELEQIIRLALSKDRKKRFSSAMELSQNLEDLKLKLITGATLPTRTVLFRRPRKRLLIGGIVAASVLMTVLLTWLLTKPSLAFHERDKLLVADVDNQTGDSVFDMALQTAIEADLQQSPYASIFDKGQVAETLKLMRLDPGSRIDEELGSDICRFSGIRAMIIPRILKAGEAYELQAILVDPRRKRHVDRIRVTALGREEVLLNAIDKLARQVRSRLGESLKSIEEADKALIQHTTSSWEALHYLSMGQAKWDEGKFKDAASFFELALEKDPKFVAARGSLGLLLIQFMNQKEKGQEELKHALADAEGITHQEYLLIKTANLWYVDEDYEAALEEYRIIRELYPDIMQGYNNAGVILRNLGRHEEAIAMFEKASEVAPRNSIPLANLWWTHLTFRRDPISAEEAARRVVALAPEIAVHHHWLGYALAAQTRFDEATEAYKKVLSLDPQHPWGLPNIAYILMVAGRAAEAVPYFEQFRELVQQGRMQNFYPLNCYYLALALRKSGQADSAIKMAEEGISDLLEKVGKTWEAAWIPLLMAKLELASGKSENVDKYIKQAKSLGLNDLGAFTYLAEVYALYGKSNEAIDTLRQVIESGHSDPYFLQIYPAFYSLQPDPNFRALFRPE